MTAGSEEMEKIQRALGSETIAELSRLTRIIPPENLSAMLRMVESMPPDVVEDMMRGARALETLDSGSGAMSYLRLSAASRAMRAVTRSFVGFDQRELSRIVAEETDVEVLLELVSSEAVLDALEYKDPLAGARLRGIDGQRWLLVEAGGAVSASEAADIIGISRQAVDARRKKGRLLAVGVGSRGWRYPMVQFDSEADDVVVRGLAGVLAALMDEGGWMSLAFLLSPEERLEDRRPIDALRAGEGARVLEVAAMLGEHGAY